MIFLNAYLLSGLALAAVPIIIHLLNRRRFQIVEWAPMKYLKLTLKTNRRRMRIEQLILLLVRTAVIVALVLAVGRPVLTRGALGSWLATRARTSRVIVIDDSMSMGYRHDQRTAMDSAKGAAKQLIGSIGAQDAVTVLLTSSAERPLVREASLQDSAKLIGRVDALGPTDAASNWGTTFKTVDEYLRTATFPQKEVTVVTDFRRSGWTADVTLIADRWAAAGVDLKLIDVGARQTDDVVLDRFEQDEPIALPGAPLKLRASIRNNTAAVVAGAQATLSVDGQARPLLLPDLPAGTTTEVPLTVTLAKAGQHVLMLALPHDALAADDVRWLCVDVRPRLDITLVDGQAEESATDFLQIALTVGSDAWQVKHVADADWETMHVGRADVIILANVAAVAPARAAELEAMVARGTGLMVFAGEQVDGDSYNSALFREGRGLLPGRLGAPVDEPTSGLSVEGFDDSPLAPLAKLAPGALAGLRPRRLLDVELPAKPQDVRVLARWNDAQSHPAVIEKRFGRGRVLLWTVTADRQWSDWPVDPSYVLAVRSAALAVARPDSGADNVTAGQVMEYRPGDGDNGDGAAIVTPRIVPPGEQTAQPLVTVGGLLRYSDATMAGAYTLMWRDAAGVEQSHVMCASFDRAEADLEPISDRGVTELLGQLRPTIIHYTGGATAEAEKGRELWRGLAMAVLALAAMETVLAFWVGRER